MSQKHVPTPSNFQHSRQPIHFYATTRNSMHELYNNPMSQITSIITSPNKYFSSRISPIKPHSSTNLSRSPQTQFHVDRVLNSSYSSKYTKFTTKIEMLQKNLNRLNGQHQSLMAMFDKSQQLILIKDVFESIDKLKEKLQESKRNKHIEEKRYEARHEVVYDDLIQKFGEVEKTQFHEQRKKVIQLEQQNKKLVDNTSKTKVYDTIFSYNVTKIDDLKQNTQRYMNQINSSLRKQLHYLLKKYKVQDKIKEKQQKVQEKIQQIKLKLGQLKCLAQYEMFLAKENQFNSQLNRLKNEFENGKKAMTQDQKVQKMNLLELKFIKDEMKFVTMQSADRLTFHLANIDSKFVKIIQKYESKLKKPSKHKLNSKTNHLSSKIKTQSNTQEEAQKISSEVTKVSHEFNGLKKYFNQSTQKVIKLETDVKEPLIQDEFIEFLQDFEGKLKLLEQNVKFFKSSCAKQAQFSP